MLNSRVSAGALYGMKIVRVQASRNNKRAASTSSRIIYSISGFFKSAAGVKTSSVEDEFEVPLEPIITKSTKVPAVKTNVKQPKEITAKVSKSAVARPFKKTQTTPIRVSLRKSTKTSNVESILPSKESSPIKSKPITKSMKSVKPEKLLKSVAKPLESGRPIRNSSSNAKEFEIEITDCESQNDSEFESEKTEKRFKSKAKINKNNLKRSPSKTSKNDARWERIKQVLASGGMVEALPGRVDEFDWIKRTVSGLLESSLGGCLYISGVPGTGKTATTHRTLDALSLAALKGECRDFDFVEINGMRLSDPGQAYSILAKTVFRGQGRVPSGGALALQKLESHFKTQQKSKTPGRPCVVLLDELDLLLRKKQSILYHFFEWPNWTNSQLIVITIANTMDLPERFLSNRISSRLGLTRYNFKPYDHAALANIIEHQLKDYVKYLGKDAIQLCARKVSAVSGDARRAVNLAKRAVDYFRSCSQEQLLTRMTGKIVEKVSEGSEMSVVNLRLMDIILKDALQANPVEIIGQLAKHQRILLLSIILARKRLEEEMSIKGGTKIIGNTGNTKNGSLTVNRVLEQHFQLCRTHQYHPLPSLQELHCLLESLEALRLLRCVKFREYGPEAIIQLLVHEEDVRKGLGDDQALKKYIRE